MLPFLVSVEGLTEEGKGKWVLAVDPTGERLLLSHEDKSLHWHPMAECTFSGTFPPGTPQPVVVVEPKPPGSGVVVPGNGRPIQLRPGPKAN